MTAHAALARRRTRRADGIVLLALLIALTLGGIALMAAVDVWTLARQRGQEQELLFVGDQYRRAIQRYYFGAPAGTPRVLPARIEDLLEDDRYPMPVRHLRRAYRDPVTGSDEWGLLRLGDRVAGVYSLSQKEPIKQAGFAAGYQHFEGLKSYREWLFAISSTGRPLTVNPDLPGTPANGDVPSFPPPRPVPRNKP